MHKGMEANARKRLGAIVVLLSGASVAATAAAGQTTTNAAPPNAANSGVMAQTAPAGQTGLQDIVVTAQRREQALSKVPLSVQALSAQTLRTQVITDTPSLVQSSPSVAFTSVFSASASSFVVRGIGSGSGQGFVQQSTAMIVDGVPLARPAEFVSDLSDISRIEILRGPQGTLFGKNATAGVINIVTQKPTDKFEGSIEAGGTTDDEASVRGLVNVPVTDRIRVRVSGYYKHLDPLIKNEGTGGNIDGYKSYGFNAKVAADLADNLSLLVTADYRKNRDTFGQSVDVLASTAVLSDGTTLGSKQIAILGFTPTPGVVRDNHNGNVFDLTKGYSVTAELGWTISDKLKFTSVSAYRSFQDDSDVDTDNTPAGVQQGLGFAPNPTDYPIAYVNHGPPRLPESVRYFSEEDRLNYTDDRLTAVGGFFYQTLTDRQPGPGDTPLIFNGVFVGIPQIPLALFYTDTKVEAKINDDTWAVFGDLTYKIGGGFSVFGGVRYTHETVSDQYASQAYQLQIADLAGNLLHNPDGSLIFDPVTGDVNGPSENTNLQLKRATNNVSGRIGIQYQPTRNVNLYFSYNRGYKGPAVDTSTAVAADLGVPGYSPILKPEIARSFELGTKLQLFDNRAQLSLNLFDEHIANLQQDIAMQNAQDELINVGGVHVKGVEFEGRALVTIGLTLDAAATYLDPRYTGNSYLACYPGQTATQGCVGGLTNVRGEQTAMSQKWRFALGADYENELPSAPFSMLFHVGYDWFDKTPYMAGGDPLEVEPQHGLLDASLTLTTHDKRWQVQLYGKNLTNDFYYAARVNVNALIARVSGYIPRDYSRYGGIRVKFDF